MNNHLLSEHKENPEEVEFEWKVIGKHRKPLLRQLDEAVNINRIPKEENMNSKFEYFKQNIRRIGIENNENDHQCNYCGRLVATVTELEEHKKYIHIRFQCDCTDCDYVSFGERDLDNHRNATHRLDRHECKQCKSSFKSVSQLEDHEILVHKAYKCKKGNCDFQTSKEKEWRSHNEPTPNGKRN